MDSNPPTTRQGKNIYCKKEENLKDCPSTYPDCPRKGMCCECVKHHREKGELPACYFSEKAEKTFDRSIENFIKEQK
jgi:hypothetical protein